MLKVPTVRAFWARYGPPISRRVEEPHQEVKTYVEHETVGEGGLHLVMQKNDVSDNRFCICGKADIWLIELLPRGGIQDGRQIEHEDWTNRGRISIFVFHFARVTYYLRVITYLYHLP